MPRGGIVAAMSGLLIAFGIVLFALCLFLILIWYWASEVGRHPQLERIPQNPILSPDPTHPWEANAVFNPAAVNIDGTIHLFYRALGPDGISRIGHAQSQDGINFTRCPNPVFGLDAVAYAHSPHTSPARLSYDTVSYASGGGWGGTEDPRTVTIDDRVYMTFNIFNGWDAMSVGITSISTNDVTNKIWSWNTFQYFSHPKARHKNWVLFPEKINGKFAVFHNLFSADANRVCIAYIDDPEEAGVLHTLESPDPQRNPNRVTAWHNRTRSAGAPPIKTPEGWLLFYHAMDTNDPNRYKLGCLLLDLNDPERVLCRAQKPILAPDMWYENDWKPGILYASGAVVKDDDLLVYYGGGDKYIAVAKIKLRDFLRQLKNHEVISLQEKK